jgi:hypothetical protein
MQCPSCGLQLAYEDNFCRRCGSATAIIDVPAVRGEARAPSVWQDAKPAVARGVVLIAAGAVLRFLVVRAGRALITRASSGTSPLARLASLGSDHVPRGRADEIEMIWYRRIRR